jgi:hypothetical protein
MESLAALWIPHGAALFAIACVSYIDPLRMMPRVVHVALSFVPDRIAGAPTIWTGLSTKGAVIAEFMRAILPTDGTDTVIACLTFGVTQSAVQFFIRSAT